MCARFSLSEPGRLLERYPGLRGAGGYARRYNIAPTQDVLAARDGEIVSMRWGLVPRWSADSAAARRLINARVESLAEKPAFRDALRARRCVVFADGFYEWTGTKQQRLPFRFTVDGGAPFAFAALYEPGRRGEGAADTCTIVTCPPNALLQPYHDRMPAILDDAALEPWLRGSVDDALAAVVPMDERRMAAYPVTPAMNNPNFDDPRCIEPLAGGAPPSLFDAPAEGRRP